MNLFEAAAGKLIFRRADGTVMLDTAERMPAITGTIETSVTAAWTQPAGEVIQGRIVGGGTLEYRWVHPATARESSVDLGAAPTSYTPNFLLTRFKATRTPSSSTMYLHARADTMFSQGQWITLNSGSIWVEHMKTSNANEYIGNRHWDVAIESGRWVLKLRESTRAYNTSYSTALGSPGSSAASYAVDIALAWGVFDL